MAVSNIPAASAAGLQPKYQKFTSSGTFTLPTGYGVSKPLLVNVQVIGGGGGGSGWTNDNPTSGGSLFLSIQRNGFFGAGATGSFNETDIAGRAGGSGGLAATQMYLTTDLTITVGAAGTRGSNSATNVTLTGNFQDNQNGAGNTTPSWYGNTGPTNTNIDAALLNATANGGTGGTSTAGSVSAGGGTGGTINYVLTRNVDWNNAGSVNTSNGISDNVSRGVGAGGTPSGTTGDATPLLGTIAGGSTNTTSVFGSFGIGGKKGDGNTSTGVEGTGGGASSIGGSGAVILTWWE